MRSEKRSEFIVFLLSFNGKSFYKSQVCMDVDCFQASKVAGI
jgi:hypothetical protein